MTTTATNQAVKLPSVGMGFLSWLCTNGEQVQQGQPVARFTVDGKAHAVTATATGRLTIRTVLPENVTTQGGNPIGSIDPSAQGTTPPQSPKIAASVPMRDISHNRAAPRGDAVNAPQSQIRATTPTTTTSTPPESRHDAPQAATDGKRRRGFDVPQPEPILTVLESGAAVNPSKKQPKKKTRTAHTTYHVTEQQAAALIDLSTNFRKDPDTPSYSASEIVRAAVEHLLNQDRPTVEAILNYNRNREKRGGYGAGWRKPNQK